MKTEPDALLREPGCMPASFSDSNVLDRREFDAACTAAASSCNGKPSSSLGRLFEFTYEALSSFQAIQQAIRRNGGVLTRMTLFDDTRAAVAANPAGVYRPGPGARKQEGHAVVLTGYDNINFTWSVLNSWGPDFGVGGVFKVAMDAGTGACWCCRAACCGAGERCACGCVPGTHALSTLLLLCCVQAWARQKTRTRSAAASSRAPT